MNTSLQRNALFATCLEKGRSRGRRIALSAVIGVAFVSASACSSTPARDGSSATLAPAVSTIARPDGAVRVDTENREVAQLWASAERAIAENKRLIALELLYEALEVDPQNSLLWSRAAELQLDAVEPTLAESYAERSNFWAGNNNALLYRNWLIIEQARSMRGDLLGVRDARKQAQLYQYR